MMEMNSHNYDTGISSEVFTVKSSIRLLDIFNLILEKKSNAVLDLFHGLIEDSIIEKNSSIIIIGSYFTGTAIAKHLKANHFNDITIVDIYPHLEGLINSKIGNPIKKGEYGKSEHLEFDMVDEFKDMGFSSDLNLIKNADIVIDTTGFGGINETQSKSIFCNVFLIEDPVAEDNDSLLKSKNNISHRADLVNSNHKYILKTKGLNTKTSGTMTFTIDVARQSMNALLARKGVLYCSSEMTFFEEIIFKEKDLDRFFSLIESPAIKVSTILPFDCDDVLREFIDEIHSEILIR